MWTDEIIELLKLEHASGSTYVETAKSIKERFGVEFSRAAIAGKLMRLRDAGELERRPPHLGADIKPEKAEQPRKWRDPILNDADRLVGGHYARCQWIGDDNKKCHEPIGRRFPGVVNYCTYHQIEAVSISRRHKVVEFHQLDSVDA